MAVWDGGRSARQAYMNAEHGPNLGREDGGALDAQSVSDCEELLHTVGQEQRNDYRVTSAVALVES